MFSHNSLAERFFMRLEKFPLLACYLKRSLAERLKCDPDNWYENRLMRYILRKDSEWARDLECAFNEGLIDTIANSEEIFSSLSGTHGTQSDYDNQLFDALAEVRLIRWARQCSYETIKKLKRKQHGGKTPDFWMTKRDEVVLAEAKHLRTRDYLLSFIENRLEGLALKTGRLRKFGLTVYAEKEYDRKRNNIVGAKAAERAKNVSAARGFLTEACLESLESTLNSNPCSQTEIKVLDMKFSVRGDNTPGRVYVYQIGWRDCKHMTEQILLPKLCSQLKDALRQIKDYMATSYSGRPPSKAVVFLTGTGPDQWDWKDFWDMLCKYRDVGTWRIVCAMHEAANEVIGMPFELIVNKGNLREFGPFPWKPEDCNAE